MTRALQLSYDMPTAIATHETDPASATGPLAQSMQTWLSMGKTQWVLDDEAIKEVAARALELAAAAVADDEEEERQAAATASKRQQMQNRRMEAKQANSERRSTPPPRGGEAKVESDVHSSGLGARASTPARTLTTQVRRGQGQILEAFGS